MPIATRDILTWLYARSKPYEDMCVQKALEHFNEFTNKPYRVVKLQNKANHRSTLYDAELSNGETGIKIEAKQTTET